MTPYRLCGTPLPRFRPSEPFPRRALAAAHVVADPNGDDARGVPIDWDATLAFRRHLLDHGFGIAEAMDTAQRGNPLMWDDALALTRKTLAICSPDERSRIFSGASTDDGSAPDTVDAVIAAYLEQIGALQAAGARVIVMASPDLVRVARGADDYSRVYAALLAEADQPVILHWLGEMFAPSLAGYWGHASYPAARDVVLDIVHSRPDKVAGIKLSLLDADKERDLRARLPEGVRMFTGDDFNYAELIAGDDSGHSDALLGVLDPIAPAAAPALAALGRGDRARYDALLAPTVPLARRMFEAPTRFYKTGVVFLAWLNGHQDNFTMLGGAQGARNLTHLADLFRLADMAGLLADPDLATCRMRRLLDRHAATT